MTTVRIPPVLRQATEGAKRIELPGATVGEVLASLVASHPAIAPQLLDGAGELNRFVNVFLNETDIRHLKALETPTGEQDTLILLPAMAGGAGDNRRRRRRRAADADQMPRSDASMAAADRPTAGSPPARRSGSC
ncbi:MAG: MoaD/ThiS family protein [Chloroflexota bacterium]|nr:MoaD/ThiS family protein [Chloroflexota bacterium]